jgi:membrane-bound lytic murein transglycosylase A
VRSRFGGLALALLLAACATKPPPARRYEPPRAPVSPSPKPSTLPERVEPTSFAALSGWAEEDHTAALAAYAATCDPAASVCREARDAGLLAPDEARRFLETHFRPERIEGDGLLTAYFMPIYPARAKPGGEFSAPVRPRPADLPRHPSLGDYADRAAIAARPATDAVAWMRPEDLFFLQIQGSGVLVFQDGTRARAVFDGTNGAAFVGIAAPMRREGLLADRETSAGGIRGWLAAHRGPQADAVMNQDPRYVFFRLGPDDGGEPAGAAGKPLIAGRSLAVDPSRHAMGELFWIDASAPALAGAFPTYRRLAIALDTGGAIKGDVRADLYMGRGDAAGLEAGKVRHNLRLYRLIPTP